MSLLGQPIPPLDHEPNPHGAPPGVTVNFGAFLADNGGPWWLTRPEIKPRLTIIHTNGASVEASTQSQINWANSGRYSHTHPHYAINAPTPSKFVPSDRRGIGNNSNNKLEALAGETQDVSFWSLVVETADAGYIAGIGDFLHDHDELVARIIAYEAIVHDLPISVPDVWNGEGVVTHTAPFDYPHYTNARGKTCPNPIKKARVLTGDILPRAQEIHARWTGDNMSFFNPIRIVDSRKHTPSTLMVGQFPVTVPAELATAAGVFVTVTAVDPAESGYITLWGSGPRPAGSCLNPSVESGTVANSTTVPLVDGKFMVYVHGKDGVQLLIDLNGTIG